MSFVKHTEKALKILRGLPRIQIFNIRDNPGASKPTKRGRGQTGGKTHGAGQKGSLARMNYMRLGYETGNFPFYRRFPMEPYYKNHVTLHLFMSDSYNVLMIFYSLRREYLPITMEKLQLLIDTVRLDPSKPIDVIQLCNSGLFDLRPEARQYGFQLKDDGIEKFKAKIHIEVQHASELIISTIERNGGVIRTAYYDQTALMAMKNTKKFFERGVPIPRRMIPPQDAIDYYTDPKTRGYLADPEEISHERLVLAQKYGYELPKIEDDPLYEMFCEAKDPRQIFYGLEPGWVVNLSDQVIIKPVSESSNSQNQQQQSTESRTEATA